MVLGYSRLTCISAFVLSTWIIIKSKLFIQCQYSYWKQINVNMSTTQTIKNETKFCF